VDVANCYTFYESNINDLQEKYDRLWNSIDSILRSLANIANRRGAVMLTITSFFVSWRFFIEDGLYEWYNYTNDVIVLFWE